MTVAVCPSDNDNSQHGFVRTQTSYDPQHDPTFVDEGNNEVFTVEQTDAEGNVHQLVLALPQAIEMRDKLSSWLEKHVQPRKVKPPTGVIARAAAALPVMLLAACKLG